jgi:hypothetical protein
MQHLGPLVRRHRQKDRNQFIHPGCLSKPRFWEDTCQLCEVQASSENHGTLSTLIFKDFMYNPRHSFLRSFHVKSP